MTIAVTEINWSTIERKKQCLIPFENALKVCKNLEFNPILLLHCPNQSTNFIISSRSKLMQLKCISNVVFFVASQNNYNKTIGAMIRFDQSWPINLI